MVLFNKNISGQLFNNFIVNNYFFITILIKICEKYLQSWQN